MTQAPATIIGTLVIAAALGTACRRGSGDGGQDGDGGSGDGSIAVQGDAGGAAGAAGGGGTTSDARAGGAGGADAADPQFGIWAMDGSESIALTKSVNATNGRTSATITASTTISDPELPQSMTLSITSGAATIAPGTFQCATSTASVTYSPMAGVTYVANSTNGSCIIIPSTVGSRRGDITQGAFTATVVPMTAGADLPETITIVNGRFEARLP